MGKFGKHCGKQERTGSFADFRRVENQAGERDGVAIAPQPDSHRTATPTVSRFSANKAKHSKKGLPSRNFSHLGVEIGKKTEMTRKNKGLH